MRLYNEKNEVILDLDSAAGEELHVALMARENKLMDQLGPDLLPGDLAEIKRDLENTRKALYALFPTVP